MPKKGVHKPFSWGYIWATAINNNRKIYTNNNYFNYIIL